MNNFKLDVWTGRKLLFREDALASQHHFETNTKQQMIHLTDPFTTIVFCFTRSGVNDIYMANNNPNKIQKSSFGKRKNIILFRMESGQEKVNLKQIEWCGKPRTESFPTEDADCRDDSLQCGSSGELMPTYNIKEAWLIRGLQVSRKAILQVLEQNL